MRITEILTSLEPEAASVDHLAAAAHLAAVHQARLTVLCVLPVHEIPLGARLQMPDLDQLLAARDREAAAKAQAAVTALMATKGIAWQWEEATGRAEQILLRRARTADLVVTPAGGRQDPSHLIGHLILQSGRPTLAVPDGLADPVCGRRVLCAWDGGREATRALHDALPLLARAEMTELLLVVPAERPDSGEFGAAVCAFLARHGVTAAPRVARLAAGAGVDDVILQQQAETGADLVVMGAFGRPRLQEVVLGSVTEGVVNRSPVPVLLSH